MILNIRIDYEYRLYLLVIRRCFVMITTQNTVSNHFIKKN